MRFSTSTTSTVTWSICADAITRVLWGAPVSHRASTFVRCCWGTSKGLILNPAVPCAGSRHLQHLQWHANPVFVTRRVNCGVVESEANKGRTCAARNSTAGFRLIRSPELPGAWPTAWDEGPEELGNSEYLCPLISRRLSFLKGTGGLPISCLSCAPTASNVGRSKASMSNSQIAGRREDRFKSATESKGRQDAANHLYFGC